MDINATPLPATTSRAEWLEQRKQGIGSSDASTILGLNPYNSPYALWLEKTGQTPLDPTPDPIAAERMEWGNLMEPLILEQTARRLGITLTKPEVAYHHPERPWQRANLDGFDAANYRVFEAKNTSLRNADQWQDQIPDHAEVQATHAATVIGAKSFIVAGLIDGNTLKVYEFDVNPNVAEILVEQETKFWHHVTTNTAPDIDGAAATTTALTKELGRRKDFEEVPAEEAEKWLKAYWEAKNRAKEATQAEATAKNHLARLMGDAAGIQTGDRVWATARRGVLKMKDLEAGHPELVEKYTVPTPKFDTKAFKEEHPDLYTKFQSVSVLPKPLSA